MTSARDSFAVPTDSVTTELVRHLEEALRCLEVTDLRGANAALKRACTEAASPRKDVYLSRNLGADDGAAQRAAKQQAELISPTSRPSPR
jgi:hypothetical protein